MANIPVLSDQILQQKLPEIKIYVGFSLRNHYDKSNSHFLQYMYSWLSAHKDKQCAAEPTWRKFLDALKHIDLTEMALQIEECLKRAPVIVQAENKEGKCITLHAQMLKSCIIMPGNEWVWRQIIIMTSHYAATGIEEVHKLQVRLKSLHDQLHDSEDTFDLQEFQSCVNASYELCFTAARKIDQEQSNFKDDVEKLTKDKSQLMIKNVQLLGKNEHLKKQLAEGGN